MFSILLKRYLIHNTVCEPLNNYLESSSRRARACVLYILLSRYLLRSNVGKILENLFFKQTPTKTDAQQVLLGRSIVRAPLYSHVKSSSSRGKNPCSLFFA